MAKYGISGYSPAAPTGTQIIKLNNSSGAAYAYQIGSQITTTAANLTLTTAHAGIVVVNKADGAAIVLPAAAGTGVRYHIIIGTTVTSNSTTIKVADATDVMTGLAMVAQDAANTMVGWETAGTSDTITWNGTTTGGIKGDGAELIDIATNLWYVRIFGSATGTEATPFSATVS